MDDIRREVRAKVEAGINYVILNFARVAYDQEPLQRFAEEVAPEFV